MGISIELTQEAKDFSLKKDMIQRLAPVRSAVQ